MKDHSQAILFFDSGIGGLGILREARILMPKHPFIYVIDNEGFPYGPWKEDKLRIRLLTLFYHILKKYEPLLCVIACNTASILALDDLRAAFPDYPFIGTVPAIKVAAKHTRSGLISVLATPVTIRHAYTKNLIVSFASQCFVQLVASEKLAGYAEDYLRGKRVDLDVIRSELLPCFVEENGKYTDIVVLACTHYPFLTNIFRKFALWPVDWLDPAEAIARRARSLLPTCRNKIETKEDLAYFTASQIDFAIKRLLHDYGFKYAGLV
ncbi:MAG: glutamate racemase [Candidatus Tokpelaia sp. JSC188]|nr:MAG: glutamate racemase [Candidatus Tokpelaia sp. JSC188]